MYYKVVRLRVDGVYMSSQLNSFNIGHTLYKVGEFCGSGSKRLEAEGYGPLVFNDLESAKRFVVRHQSFSTQHIFTCHVRGIMPKVKTLVKFVYIKDILERERIRTWHRIYIPANTVMVKKVRLIEEVIK